MNIGALGERKENMERDSTSVIEPPERKTLTVEEVQKILGLGKNQVYQAIRKNQIPAIQIGRRLLVPKAAIDRMLAGE